MGEVEGRVVIESHLDTKSLQTNRNKSAVDLHYCLDAV